MLALVGMTMPDNSVFAVYDAALDALLAEAKKQAGAWGWGATAHDPVIETKARSWMSMAKTSGMTYLVRLQTCK